MSADPRDTLAHSPMTRAAGAGRRDHRRPERPRRVRRALHQLRLAGHRHGMGHRPRARSASCCRWSSSAWPSARSCSAASPTNRPPAGDSRMPRRHGHRHGDGDHGERAGRPVDLAHRHRARHRRHARGDQRRLGRVLEHPAAAPERVADVDRLSARRGVRRHRGGAAASGQRLADGLLLRRRRSRRS